MKFIIKIKKNSRGLTLMETTIALGILMMGILASLLLMNGSFRFSHQSEYEIVVVNLAREGLEIVRTMRNNYSDSNDFNIFNLSGDHYYAFDAITTNSLSDVNVHQVSGVTQASQCSACRLYFTNGRYLHTVGGAPTIFRRLIKIKSTNHDYDKKIISEVSWQVKNVNYSYSVETYLSDWQ